MTDREKLESLPMAYARMKAAEQVYLDNKGRAERVTAHISEVASKSSPENVQEIALVNMIDAKDIYAEQMEKYAAALKAAMAIIDRLPDPKWYRVMHGKYIMSLSWQDIADQVDCTARNCQLIHGKALEWLRLNPETQSEDVG